MGELIFGHPPFLFVLCDKVRRRLMFVCLPSMMEAPGNGFLEMHRDQWVEFQCGYWLHKHISAGILPAICKRATAAGAPAGAGSYWKHWSSYRWFSPDVTAAMFVYRTIEKTVFWEFHSIIMQNMSHNLLLFCTQTWPSPHVVES